MLRKGHWLQHNSWNVTSGVRLLVLAVAASIQVSTGPGWFFTFAVHAEQELYIQP